MLDTFRKNSRSVIIYILFGILIAVFVISFGPQAGARRKTPSGGCGTQEAFALKVRGHTISENSWRYAIMAKYGNAATGPKAKMLRARETVMDALITRELLAQAAEDAGFRITLGETEARIERGEVYILGQSLGGQAFFKNGVFDYETLEGFAKSSLSLPSVATFVQEQQREFLAQDERELLQGSLRVSPEEVLDRYRDENTRVEIDYVKYKPLDYRHTIELSDADVDAYLAAHDADVKKKFELDKNLYAAAGGKWVKLRQVVVKKGPADDAKKDAPDPQRAKAEAALNRIKAGEDFAKVAKELSEDERSARRGGLADWRQTGKLDPKLAEAVAPLAAGSGKTTEVVETATGYTIAAVEATSDQDLGYDQVKKDLAEPMARDDRARSKAREDAETALAKIKSGTPMDAMFEPAVKPGAPAGGAGDDDIDLAPPPGAEIDHPGDPAPEPVDNGDAPVPTPTPAPKKDEPAKKKADDKTKPHARQAETPVRPNTPPPAVGGGEKKPVVEDKKPVVEDKKPVVVEKTGPKLQKSGPLYRDGIKLRGIGESKELTRAVFKEIKVGDVAPQIYEVDAGDMVNDSFVIARVTVRTDPDMADFEKEKAGLAKSYASAKYYGLLDGWVQRRCLEARPEISVNPTYVEYGDESGVKQRSAYQPCTSSGEMFGSPTELGGAGGEPIDMGDLPQE